MQKYCRILIASSQQHLPGEFAQVLLANCQVLQVRQGKQLVKIFMIWIMVMILVMVLMMIRMIIVMMIIMMLSNIVYDDD